MRFFAVILQAVCLCSLLSCSEPRMTEMFVRPQQKDADGSYAFCLEMDDSLSVYSLDFYTRIDCPPEDFAALGDMQLDIRLYSPAGKEYSECVYLPVGTFSASRYFSKDYIVPYRSGFRPSEPGSWTMKVTVIREEAVKGLRGLGVRLSRKDMQN